MNRKQILNKFWAVFFATFLIQACGLPSDSGGDQIEPPQTEILDVKVQPNTVAPGDTATFTCVIKDSLDKRFTFGWLIAEGEVIGAKYIGGQYNEYVSETSQIKWIAPSSEKRYKFTVFANNGSKDSVSVQDGFAIVVE